MKKVLSILMVIVLLWTSSLVYAKPETYTLVLSIEERIMAGQLIPARGSLEEGIIAVDLRKKVNPTQEEIEKYNLTEGISSALLKDADIITISLTYLEIDMLRKEIQRISDKKELFTSEIAINFCKKIKDAKPNKVE